MKSFVLSLFCSACFLSNLTANAMDLAQCIGKTAAVLEQLEFLIGGGNEEADLFNCSISASYHKKRTKRKCSYVEYGSYANFCDSDGENCEYMRPTKEVCKRHTLKKAYVQWKLSIEDMTATSLEAFEISSELPACFQFLLSKSRKLEQRCGNVSISVDPAVKRNEPKIPPLPSRKP